jgi:hypothetical protein
MIIGSACVLVPSLKYIGPPNCIHYWECEVLETCVALVSLSWGISNNWIENWISLGLIMIIGSACMLIPSLEYIGPPNCVQGWVWSTWNLCCIVSLPWSISNTRTENWIFLGLIMIIRSVYAIFPSSKYIGPPNYVHYWVWSTTAGDRIWTCGPLRFKLVSLWCLFFDPHVATHQSNIRVWLRKVTEEHVHTLEGS